MKTKITLKTAIKAKKGFNKKCLKRFCWEKKQNERVSTLLRAKGLRWFGEKP
jgi:hypothetical protein